MKYHRDSSVMKYRGENPLVEFHRADSFAGDFFTNCPYDSGFFIILQIVKQIGNIILILEEGKFS